MRCLDPHDLDRLSPHVRPRVAELDEDLERRIRLLRDKDRLLMELTLNNGASRRQMAVALNVTAGNVSRRLRVVVDRLNNPLVKALTSSDCNLPSQHRQVGIEHFLLGSSLRQLTRQHALTYAQLKRMLEYIRGWHRGMSVAPASFSV